MWEAVHGKVLTIDNLRRRGVCLVEWCYLCRCDGEFEDHILLHCSVVRELWFYVLSILNYVWVMPKRVFHVLLCWKRKFNKTLGFGGLKNDPFLYLVEFMEGDKW